MDWLTLITVLSLAIFLIVRKKSRKKVDRQELSPEDNQLLEKHVAYYRALSTEEKMRFQQEVVDFLSLTTFEGVKTEVEPLDRILVAASAVIPVFAFPDWHYQTLTTVLLYPENFNERFELTGGDRPVMGMVGNGYMNGKMILSRPSLREGFLNESDKNNTAIHEFVHLIDMADGAVDGIPEILLRRQYSLPWIDMLQQQIKKIGEGSSDISPYGATSKTEFFAVAAEYFFERPDLFQSKHPDLYKAMTLIFKQEPTIAKTSAKRKIGRNDPCYCGSGKKYKNCHGQPS